MFIIIASKQHAQKVIKDIYSDYELDTRINNLEHGLLDLSHSKISDTLIDCKDFTALNFSFCENLTLDKISLKNGHKIINLNLSNVNGGSLEKILASCPNVEVLYLNGIKISSDNLVYITKCAKLDSLHLSATLFQPLLHSSSYILDIPELALHNYYSFSWHVFSEPKNNLLSLSLINCTFNIYQLNQVFNNFKNLTTLNLQNSSHNPLSSDKNSLVLRGNLKIEHLNLSNISHKLMPSNVFKSILKKSPALKSLKIADSDFLVAGLYSALCEGDVASIGVEELDLSNCSSLTNAVLYELLNYFQNLQRLKIRNCPGITASAFENVDLSNILALDITNCNNLKNEDLKEIFSTMPSLQCLIMENRHHIGSDIFSKAYFPNLMTVNLRDCVFLTDMCLSSLFLSTISQENNVSKINPNNGGNHSPIRNLNIRNCRLITGSGLIDQDGFTITNLTCLILQDCVALKPDYFEDIISDMAKEHAINTIGCNELPASLIGDVVSPFLTYLGVSNSFDYYLRWYYISCDEEIVKVANNILDEATKALETNFSLGIEVEYDAAAGAIDARNNLKDVIRNWGDPVDKFLFEQRNLIKYGDSLGPGPDKLLGPKDEYLASRLLGKNKIEEGKHLSAEEVLKSVARTDEKTNELARQRAISGALFLGVEIMLIYYRCRDSDNKTYMLSSEACGKATSFMLVRALGYWGAYCGYHYFSYPFAAGFLGEYFLSVAGNKVGQKLHSATYSYFSSSAWKLYTMWNQVKNPTLISSDALASSASSVKEDQPRENFSDDEVLDIEKLDGPYEPQECLLGKYTHKH